MIIFVTSRLNGSVCVNITIGIRYIIFNIHYHTSLCIIYHLDKFKYFLNTPKHYFLGTKFVLYIKKLKNETFIFEFLGHIILVSYLIYNSYVFQLFL